MLIRVPPLHASEVGEGESGQICSPGLGLAYSAAAVLLFQIPNKRNSTGRREQTLSFSSTCLPTSRSPATASNAIHCCLGASCCCWGWLPGRQGSRASAPAHFISTLSAHWLPSREDTAETSRPAGKIKQQGASWVRTEERIPVSQTAQAPLI